MLKKVSTSLNHLPNRHWIRSGNFAEINGKKVALWCSEEWTIEMKKEAQSHLYKMVKV